MVSFVCLFHSLSLRDFMCWTAKVADGLSSVGLVGVDIVAIIIVCVFGSAWAGECVCDWWRMLLAKSRSPWVGSEQESDRRSAVCKSCGAAATAAAARGRRRKEVEGNVAETTWTSRWFNELWLYTLRWRGMCWCLLSVCSDLLESCRHSMNIFG